MGQGVDIAKFSFLDVVGDIHGSLVALEKTLWALGYRQRGSVWQHPDRLLVTLGDMVDRGENSAQVIALLRAMQLEGKAVCLLGNHEYNHLCAAVHPDKTQYPLIDEHTFARNQMAITFRSYAGDEQARQRDLAWMRTLPLFGEFPGLRVAHAVWSEPEVANWRRIQGEQELDDNVLIQTSIYGTQEQQIMKLITRGLLVDYPNKRAVRDVDGFFRRRARGKFWLASDRTYAEFCMNGDFLPAHIAQQNIPSTVKNMYTQYDHKQLPLIVGHYGLGLDNGGAKPSGQLSSNVYCVDFGAYATQKLGVYSHALEATELHFAHLRTFGE